MSDYEEKTIRLMIQEGGRLLLEIDQLQAENEKLRELVRDMWDFFCVVPDDPHVFKEELDFSVEVWKRMRKLGVEVK